MDLLIPPQNVDAEKAVIGGVLIDAESYIKVGNIVTAEDFYEQKHKLIFTAIEELFKLGRQIDIITLTSQLKKNKATIEAGGSAYLAEVVAITPTAANITDYAQLVKEMSIRRKLISLSGKITELARNEKEALHEVVNGVESMVYNLSNVGTESGFVHIKNLLEQSFEVTEKMNVDGDGIRGVKSGFPNLDKMLSGLNKSDFIIVAARPAVGKSSFALDIARHAALHDNRSVGFFSLEMSGVQIMDRILSMELGVNLFNLRTGRLTDKNFRDFAQVADKIANSNLFVDDTPGQTIHDIRTKSRKLKVEKGLDLLIIDYLQLIMAGSKKENRVQEVSEISRFLKIIARELNIPVIALAQLSRAVEQRTDKKPQLSDLRESGSIEQDADIVMFLQRNTNLEAGQDDSNSANLFIAKHRNGPTGFIDLVFVDKLARFRELAKQ